VRAAAPQHDTTTRPRFANPVGFLRSNARLMVAEADEDDPNSDGHLRPPSQLSSAIRRRGGHRKNSHLKSSTGCLTPRRTVHVRRACPMNTVNGPLWEPCALKAASTLGHEESH